MGNAIEEIKAKIGEFRGRIDWLESEIPKAKGKLETLVAALAILQGENGESESKPVVFSPNQPVPIKSSGHRRSRTPRADSSTAVAVSVLKTMGSAMKAADIFTLASGSNPKFLKRNFISNMYRLAREGRIFEINSGTVSLLEWAGNGTDQMPVRNETSVEAETEEADFM